MAKAIAWVRSHHKEWYRREYLRALNICLWAMIGVLLIGIPLSFATHNQLILSATFMLVFFLIGIGATLRRVDEHEKKLAKQT